MKNSEKTMDKIVALCKTAVYFRAGENKATVLTKGNYFVHSLF